jgi:hypothetical protein
VEFTTAEHASQSMDQIEDDFDLVVLDLIDVPGPASRGYRTLGAPRTLLQPPDTAPVSDVAVIRFGPRLYVAYASELAPTAGHGVIVTVAQTLVDHAWAADREQ